MNFAGVLKTFSVSRSTLQCVRFSIGSATERLEVENMMRRGPDGDNFSTEYLQKLYEVLLRSIGKVGSNQNFWRNISVVKSICKQNYRTRRCISNLTNQYLTERREFFLSHYNLLFDKVGIENVLPTE